MRRESDFCKDCGVKKTAENAYKHDRAEFQTRCKKCQSANQKSRNKLYPEIFREIKLKYKYNMTLEQWDAQLKKQKHCCKICKVDFKTQTKSPHVDHDHETNEIRGILCRYCNLLLGHYEKIVREEYEGLFINYLKGAL